MFKKINKYFFGVEKIEVKDGALFYGFITLVVFWCILFVVAIIQDIS